MKLKFGWICVVVFWMSACMWGTHPGENPAITKDTLDFHYKIVKQDSGDCAHKPDSNCTFTKVEYPVFNGQDPLNKFVINSLIKHFVFDKTETLPKHLTENNYSSNEFANIFHGLDINCTVTRQDSSLIGIMVEGRYSYHRHTKLVYFINWNTVQSRPILLNDIMSERYAGELNKIAEGIFRKEEKLSDSASLKSNYSFKNDKFALNTNYLITPLGIKFVFNKNEIKQGTADTTNLFIPYDKIKSLLRPHTVVSQYIK